MRKVKEGMVLKPESYTEYVEDFRIRPDAEIAQNRPIHNRIVGAWRSLVAHLLWEQGVGGSNPLAPTNNFKQARKAQELMGLSWFLTENPQTGITKVKRRLDP